MKSLCGFSRTKDLTNVFARKKSIGEGHEKKNRDKEDEIRNHKGSKAVVQHES
jgi:hypothetical protein